MNHRINLFLNLSIVSFFLISCSQETKEASQFDMLIGTYHGELFGSDMNTYPMSTIDLTITKISPTSFTFYFELLGSADIIEIPGVEFVRSNDVISYKRQDVDSDIEIEGFFLEDGSSGETVMKLEHSSLKGEILKR